MDIDKIKKRNYPLKSKASVDIPSNKWIKCPKCKEIIYESTYRKNFDVCPYCDYHFRLSALKRLEMIVDENTFEEFTLDIENTNPLELETYHEKLAEARKKTGLREAVLCGKGQIESEEAVICIMDSNFLMGSMGSVVGAMLSNAINISLKEKLPLIIFSASGGARMQEGIISLMQMAKVTAALTKLDEAGILYISVLTDPTYGGVTASFASLGDIILAEPHAMIGFTGPSVIASTIKEKLPEGFQTSEFLLEHGLIDKIVSRTELKKTLSTLISYHRKESL